MFEEIQHLFEGQGGEFVSPLSFIQERLKNIKAYIFDWDGVFNNGAKTDNAGSSYSEIDSMGTNLLRLAYWLSNNENLPFIAIITGENNQTAIKLAEREHFNHIYFNFKNKIQAFGHFIKSFNLKPEEVAFLFDDVLDIPIARICGLRFMVNRKGSPLFDKFVKQNQYCDYLTGQAGGNNAVREISELVLGLLNQFEPALKERIDFSPQYAKYLEIRNKTELKQFRYSENVFI
jgi:3-deoxy-D-manno-octulosonate 8-phosphate phosphatase (KDO 8-P phosphatase)